MMPEIMMGGAKYSRTKTSRTGARLYSVQETLERVRTPLRCAGVTRLANITGLDRIGIPVAVAIRPNSWGVASSAGKGMQSCDAYVSAAMEALERYHAEEAECTVANISYDRVKEKHSVIPSQYLPVRRRCQFMSAWPHDWLSAWDLIHQEEVMVPLSMVNLATRLRPYDFPVFQTTSVGLAAGGDMLEAILEGLLEVIEQDSVTCHQYRSGRRDYVTVDNYSWCSAFSEMSLVLGRLRECDITLHVRNCVTNIGIPVFEAKLLDRRHSNLGSFYGYAAHLDPEKALLKAILEAAQGHTVYIAGARDDYFRRQMEWSRIPDAIPDDSQPATPNMLCGRCLETSSVDGDIQVLIGALRRIGIDQVLVVDLSTPWDPTVIVKLIVPGLEGPIREGYQPGARVVEMAEWRI